MSLNIGNCTCATTTCVPSIMVHLNHNNDVTPWVCLVAQSTVAYLGLRLDSKASASMEEKHAHRCEALLGWCTTTVGTALVPHEVMAAILGGIVRYAALYLSDFAVEVVRLKASMKTAALQLKACRKTCPMLWCGRVKGISWRIFGSCAVTPW